MWSKVKAYLAKSSILVGIEVVQDGNHWIYNAAILDSKGSKVSLKAYKLGVHSEEDLYDFIPDDAPIYMVFNIKGILHRKSNKNYETLDKYLDDSFPNAKKEDFYGQITAQGDQKWVSIARKSLFQEILHRSTDKRYFGDNTLGLFLGNMHLVLLQELLEVVPKEIITTNSHLGFEDGRLIQQKMSTNRGMAQSDSINIGGQMIPHTLLPAFLAPLSILYGQNGGTQTVDLNAKREEYIYKKAFRLFGMTTLGVFFLALLANYFIFSSYQQSNAGLETELFAQELLVSQRDTLKVQYERKSEVFGNGEQSNLSFYADRLASSLPSSIELVELSLHPPIKTAYYDERQQPNYQTGKILVEGQCFGIVYYNNWKRALKELDWVHTLHHISYQDISEDVGAFTLEITVEDAI